MILVLKNMQEYILYMIPGLIPVEPNVIYIFGMDTHIEKNKIGEVYEL